MKCKHCGMDLVPDNRASNGYCGADDLSYFCPAHSELAEPGDVTAAAHEHEPTPRIVRLVIEAPVDRVEEYLELVADLLDKGFTSGSDGDSNWTYEDAP